MWNVRCVAAVWMGLVLAGTATVIAGEPSRAGPSATGPQATVSGLAWHTDLAAAWHASQQAGRPLLVFVTHDHCRHCVRMKQWTLADSIVTGTIHRAYVPLEMNGGGDSPLLKELAVSVYPATFIISPNAVVLDRIEGYIPPDKLAGRLAAIERLTRAVPPHR